MNQAQQWVASGQQNSLLESQPGHSTVTFSRKIQTDSHIETVTEKPHEDKISETNGSIKLTNWITKEFILKELREYTPPKINATADLKKQLDKYKPVDFGHNLNVKPPAQSDFIKSLKNPCWKVDATLHCLPYFYLLGFPKSGTTDLWTRISRHPQQAWKADNWQSGDAWHNKEVQWWTWFRFSGSTQLDARHTEGRLLNTYTRRFKEQLFKKNSSMSSNIITGDGSVSLIYDVSFHSRSVVPAKVSTNKPITAPDLTIASLIRLYTPQSKFIIIMRDPVDAMYSHYQYWPRGRARSPANFHHRVVQVLSMYTDCFKRYSIRACAYDPNLLEESDRQGVRLYHVLYVVYLSDWFKVFPREQFLIARTEDYDKDVNGHMEKIFKFLDISVLKNDTMSKISGPAHMNVRNNTPYLKETLELFQNFIKPFNDALADLLGDQRFAWNRS
ncbi:carbohydrate sulfotransferase 15-like [Lineus longissimus]|uniref:carbohydrate sulfotransferase 15-like n=1 Tax=Lineus longissimus TaxID=88925 RepID=UPI00315D2F93